MQTNQQHRRKTYQREFRCASRNCQIEISARGFPWHWAGFWRSARSSFEDVGDDSRPRHHLVRNVAGVSPRTDELCATRNFDSWVFVVEPLIARLRNGLVAGVR